MLIKQAEIHPEIEVAYPGPDPQTTYYARRFNPAGEMHRPVCFRTETSMVAEPIGHRSVLVTDNAGVLVGLVSIRGLLKAILPAYITVPRPSMVDSLEYSPIFWRDMFALQIRKIADHPIETVMAPAPETIEATANLMEATYMMLQKNARRLAVLSKGELVGVIREQDLFFEMERILGNGSASNSMVTG